MSLNRAVEKVAEAFPFELDEDRKERLLTYFRLLHQWNQSINLSGIKEPDLLVYKHLGDSLLYLDAVPRQLSTLLDIGTGAGIPGLVIKILKPELNVVLAEAVKKKCSFLHYVISVLGLGGIYVEEKRLMPERPLGSSPVGGFDAVVSQAAGSLSWLLELGCHFVSFRGVIVAIKGPRVDEELETAKRAAEELGFSLRSQERLLPILHHHRTVVEFFRKGNS